jgi:uncharacterized membrane protein
MRVGLSIRRIFVAGLLVWVPIWATFALVSFLINVLDQAFNWVPVSYRPETFIHQNIPGFNAFISLAIIFITGILVANFIGRTFLSLSEKILARIPLVRTIYTSVKQTLEVILSSNSEAFRQVVIIEYPRKGIYSLAFVTNRDSLMDDNDKITVFVPTTPNPTSGFLLIVPKAECVDMKIPVDKALKYIISLGTVSDGVYHNGSTVQAENIIGDKLRNEEKD